MKLTINKDLTEIRRRSIMTNRKNLSRLLILDILAIAVLYLIPDHAGSWTIKGILIVCLAVTALFLIRLLSGQTEKEPHALVSEIDSVSQINPGQYLSKGGPVCAGSDTRYHVTFMLKDNTSLILSLSAKQAGSLSRGMCGTLIHSGSVFAGFVPDKS